MRHALVRSWQCTPRAAKGIQEREQSPTRTADRKTKARARADTRTHLERVFGVGLLDGVHTHEVNNLLDVSELFA
jgi:hypothetical protein